MSRALLISILALLAIKAQAAGEAWGTSAAIDSEGAVWIVYAQPEGERAHVLVARTNGKGEWTPARRVTSNPEPVSADGENRPKIAIGPHGELYVSWTSPTSAEYTADVRFSRSLDGGRTWSAPLTVHRDRRRIAHRFESLIVDREGRLWLAWIDKRDLLRAQDEGRRYVGAAVYYAWSSDQGATWSEERKLADGSCECCRIALALDPEGSVIALWRHVFAGGERDHATATLTMHGAPRIERATHERWRIDACPHHGPGLAVGRDGARHAVWFTQVEGEGRVFYGRLAASGPTGVRRLPAGAMHADVAVAGDRIALAWKRFDGAATRVESWLSRDGGATFTEGPHFATRGGSDQPRLVSAGDQLALVWRRAEGVVLHRFDDAAAPAQQQSARDAEARPAPAAAIRPFTRTTLSEILKEQAGEPFWLVLWDLECTYCLRSLENLAEAQRKRPSLKAIVVATDSIRAADRLSARLAELGVRASAYAFADDAPEALRHSIDPTWLGEKPRAYRYDAQGAREAVSGVIEAAEWLR